MKRLLVCLGLLCLTLTSQNMLGQSGQEKDLINRKLQILEQQYQRNLRGLAFGEFVEFDGMVVSDSLEMRRKYIESKLNLEEKLVALESNRVGAFTSNLSAAREVITNRTTETFAGLAYVKIDKALYSFLQTDFMRQCRDFRIEAESLAATLKALGQNLRPAEVAKIRTAYNTVADEFNRFLVDIKRDFLDRKKIKMIRTNPEMYTGSLQYKMRELQDLYAQELETVAVEISGSDVYALPISALLGLIQLAADLTDFIIRSNIEARRVKEQHLDTYLLADYSFPEWYEIEIIEGNTFQDSYQDDYYTEEDTTPLDSLMSLDPFLDEPAPSLSRKKN